MFDHEKLDVYRVQLQVVAWVDELLEEMRRKAPGRTRAVRDQLDRASLSVLLNIAEANGKRQRRARAKSFDDAPGSTTESAACLDALVAKRLCDKERIQAGKRLLERVNAMLTKLIDRFDADE